MGPSDIDLATRARVEDDRDRPEGNATMALEMLNAPLRYANTLGPEVVRRAVEGGLARLAAAGIEAADLANPHVRIPHDTALALLSDVAVAAGDPAFALRAGRATQPGDFGVFDFVGRTAATLEESMLASTRYLPLLHDGAACHVDIDDEWIYWRHRLLPGVVGPPGAHEYVIASMVASSQRYLGLDIPPHEVHFIHQAPPYQDVYQEIFRTTVRFGCEYNAIITPAIARELPMQTADAPLHESLCRYADHLLTLVPRRGQMGRKVKELLAESLESGGYPLAVLAERLHTSARSLRRKLGTEGTSHKELLEEVRRERALVLLADPTEDLSQIAYRLGFSQPPAFHRAFKRWYGLGPSTYRKRYAGTPAYRFFNDKP